MTYHGDQDATRDRVRRYLKANYAEPDGTPLSEARLTELLADHDDLLQRGISVRSFAYYVGDRIAVAAGLDWAADDSDDADGDGDEDDDRS